MRVKFQHDETGRVLEREFLTWKSYKLFRLANKRWFPIKEKRR